jgi:hypothetical protein
MQRVILSTFLLCAGGSAAAQSDVRRDPSDAQARVPAVQYRSAFTEYQPYREPEIEKWREMNDQARDLGGHMGQAARPGSGDTKPATRPETAPAQEPPAGGHGGHHR